MDARSVVLIANWNTYSVSLSFWTLETLATGALNSNPNK